METPLKLVLGNLSERMFFAPTVLSPEFFTELLIRPQLSVIRGGQRLSFSSRAVSPARNYDQTLLGQLLFRDGYLLSGNTVIDLQEPVGRMIHHDRGYALGGQPLR